MNLSKISYTMRNIRYEGHIAAWPVIYNTFSLLFSTPFCATYPGLYCPTIRVYLMKLA